VSRTAICLFFLITSPLGAGCAALAKKTPTPAADLDTLALASIPPPPGERYYLLVFGSQSTPKRAKYTHTWATVVKVTDEPGVAPTVEQHTISWMPATLDIHPLRFRVEPGVNLDLDTSMREMLSHDETIAMWGPYQIARGPYLRFLTQRQFLESGTVGYQCIDTVGEAARTGGGCDCIHAITDLDPIYARGRYPLAFNGIGAARHVVHEVMIRPVIYDPPTTHDWLIPVLGLDKYPIERRQYRGHRVVPYVPGAPDLQAAPVLPLPGAPIVPKDPTPKTAPGR
jgi:hypothetical protein